MLRIVVIALILIIVSCAKKVTIAEVLPETNKDKVIWTFQLEKPPQQVENPVENIKKTVIVYFKFDSDELQESERWKINDINQPVELIGGACPIGNDDYNYTLGLRRAFSVKYFFEKNNISVESVKSVGENALLTTDKNEYRLNRRCEIKY